MKGIDHLGDLEAYDDNIRMDLKEIGCKNIN
jgi:hypothetical protein